MHSMNELFTKVDENKKAMLETWRMLVDRDCGSANKAGVDAVGKDIQHFLEALGFAVRFHIYEKAGNMLVAEYGDMSKPFVIWIPFLRMGQRRLVPLPSKTARSKVRVSWI